MTRQNTAVYTRGPIGRTMLKTAVAMLPATLAISGYNVADTFFVSKLGTVPLAAMAFTFPMVMLVSCVYRGLAVGVMTPLAHALGDNRHKKGATVATTGLMLVLALSLIVGIVGYFTMDTAFHLLGVSEETAPLVRDYMSVWYLGSVTAAVCTTCNDLLIGAGAPRVAGLMMLAGLALNVALDPIFIFGWGAIPAMGVKGAAVATVLSQFLATVVLMIFIHKRYHLLRRDVFHWRLLKMNWLVVTIVAVPSIIGTLMMPLGNGVVTRIVADFGTNAVAACSAAGRLEAVAFLVPMSLGMSLMPMVAQNYGAGLFERIDECRRFAMRFAGFFELGMAVIFALGAPFIVPIFTNEPEVQRIMILYLLIIPWGFGMIEIHRYCGFFLTGCNRPNLTAILNTMRIFVFLIPLSLIALWIGWLPGLFVARLVSDILSGVIGLVIVRRAMATLQTAPVVPPDAALVEPISHESPPL